jgi:hypothetical protein
MGLQLQQLQQQQQFRGLVGALPAAAAQDMAWGGPAEDRSSGSFTSTCSVVTANGSSFLPMLPNPAPTVSTADALYVQMPNASMGSSSPLLMQSGNDVLAPMQQQMMLPSTQAYLMQLQIQQQQLQQQAKLQALQRELQQQQNSVRAALRGMEHQGVSTPQGLAAAAAAAAAAGSNSFEGYPLAAFSSAPASFPASAVAGQPGSSSASMQAEDAASTFVCLQNGLASSMANMSIGGGINFASGPCVVGIDNSGSNALGAS